MAFWSVHVQNAIRKAGAEIQTLIIWRALMICTILVRSVGLNIKSSLSSFLATFMLVIHWVQPSAWPLLCERS